MMDVLVVDYNKWNTVQFFLELSPTVLYHMNTLLWFYMLFSYRLFLH